MKECQIYFIITLCLSFYTFINCGIHQRKLLEKLFSNYDPSERPVENESGNLNISIGICIQQIVELVKIVSNYVL
jgi:hypothetical protein